MRIGVLNNLRAGRSGREVSKVLDVLGDYPHVSHVETESVRAVPEALASLARQDVELLVVNGGDGTLQYTVSRILNGDEFDYVPIDAMRATFRAEYPDLKMNDGEASPTSGEPLDFEREVEAEARALPDVELGVDAKVSRG